MKITRIIEGLSQEPITVEIVLSDEEVEAAYRECKHRLRLQDVEAHLNDMDIDDLYGFSLEEIFGAPEIMEDILRQFEKAQDCDLPENDVMEASIRTVLFRQSKEK